MSDGSRTFDDDLENRLLSVSAGGSTTGSLTYDPLGRVRSYAAAGNTTIFLYDGDRLVEEYTGAGVRLRRYAHGPGIDEPLIWYESTGVASGQNWLIADRQGSIVATTNNTGAATTYAYDAYGIPREWTGPGGAMLSRFRYTGQAALPELQLYHYKARIYDPVIGRFLQTDPVGSEDDLNSYAYARNDPSNLTDASGHSATGGCNYHPENCLQAGGGPVDLGSEAAFARAEALRARAAQTQNFGEQADLYGDVMVQEFQGGMAAMVEGASNHSLRVAATALSFAIGAPETAVAGNLLRATIANSGKSAAEWGRIIGWGGGRNAAGEAVAAASRITPQVVADMKAAGLTREVAAGLRDGYRAAAATGRGGEVASARADLMQTILNNW